MDIADTLIDAHNLLDRLEGEFGHNDHMRDMDALMTDTMEEAEQRIAKSVNGITGIPTGLTDLNRMTSGLQNGETLATPHAPRSERPPSPSIWRGRLPCRNMPSPSTALRCKENDLPTAGCCPPATSTLTAGAQASLTRTK